MRAMDEIADPNSCISKAADDEPVFVLRAQDLFAPGLVRFWAMMAKACGAPQEKWEGAALLANDMDRWAVKNGAKYPD